MNTHETAESAIAAVTTKATYAGSAVTLVFGFTLNEIAAVAATASTVTMLVVSIWLKIRADKREQQAHDLRMQEIKAGLNDD